MSLPGSGSIPAVHPPSCSRCSPLTKCARRPLVKCRRSPLRSGERPPQSPCSRPVALAVARNAGDWAAAFVITFGTWDITFYVFLKVLLGWPASVFTWDILFLIPVPWVGPVLAPVLVSAVMIAAGVWQLRAQALGKAVRIGAAQWSGIMAGAVIIVIAFAMDYQEHHGGRHPASVQLAGVHHGARCRRISFVSAARARAPAAKEGGRG